MCKKKKKTWKKLCFLKHNFSKVRCGVFPLSPTQHSPAPSDQPSVINPSLKAIRNIDFKLAVDLTTCVWNLCLHFIYRTVDQRKPVFDKCLRIPGNVGLCNALQNLQGKIHSILSLYFLSYVVFPSAIKLWYQVCELLLWFS